MPSSNVDTVAPSPTPGLKSYGEWISEYTRRGLPRNTPPPPGYESYKDWYERMRGLPFEEAPKPSNPSSANSGPSSFVRRTLLEAGNIASRLRAIGRGVGNAFPAIGAISTIIQAIRDGKELQSLPMPADRADATAASGRSAVAAASPQSMFKTGPSAG